MANINESKLIESIICKDSNIAINQITTTIDNKKHIQKYNVWNTQSTVIDKEQNLLKVTFANLVNASLNYGKHFTILLKTDKNGKVDYNDFIKAFESGIEFIYSRLLGMEIKQINYSIYKVGNYKATRTLKRDY